MRKKMFSFSNRYLIRLFAVSPLIAVFSFLILISVLSPYFETRLMVKEFEFASLFLRKICHQYPSRCFYIFGSNMGLCARCFTIYSTLTFYCIFFSFFDINLKFKSKWIISISLMMPLIIDGITQYYGFRNSSNVLRFITGVLAGSGLSILLISFYTKIVAGLIHYLFQIVSRKGGMFYESEG